MIFLGKRIGRARGTWSRKPHTLFWYSTYFNVVLGFSSTNMGLRCNLDSHFQQYRQTQTSTENSMFIFCVIFCNVILWWNEL
jgi:hypothetical protein